MREEPEMEQASIEAATELRWIDPETTIGRLRDVLAQYPSSLRARMILADIYSDGYAGGGPAAELLYRSILRDKPEFYEAMWGLALLEGDPDTAVAKAESVALLTRAFKISGSLEVLRNLANKLWQSDKVEDSALAFRRLIYLAKRNRSAHLEKVAGRSLEMLEAGQPVRKLIYIWPDPMEIDAVR